MLFNSLVFGAFLPTVFALYWLARGSLRLQNSILVVASYVFYGWWDWRFLGLILLSTIIDYWVGIGLSKTEDARQRKRLVGLSVGANLGMLASFKYFNFFADSLTAMLGLVGITPSFVTLNIVLPVGISFYTFQTLSYSIDVSRGKIDASRDFIAFAAYVSFFPQLVAGPIERARNFLPQFLEHRKFDLDEARDGMRQMLWGFFKKVAVADTCGLIVNPVFNNYDEYSVATLAIAYLLISFQVYGDFSGYSDIAIGSARLFGFRLMKNFDYPYFSRDVAEFWRRWHISLTTWFRDYVYYPLGGSRGSLNRTLVNVMTVFTVSGLWHGANWTYVLWGAYHGLLLLPALIMGRNRQHLDLVAEGRLLPNPREVVQMLWTFGLIISSWTFFIARDLNHSWGLVSHFFTGPLIHPLRYTAAGIFLSAVMLLVEWFQRGREHGLETSQWPRWGRRLLYAFCIIAILKQFGIQQEFVYFQF